MIDVFENLVGQEKTKKKLNFYLDAYKTTRMIPNLLITAPKGCGKNYISESIGRGLYRFDENGKIETDGASKPVRKKFLYVNCSTLRNSTDFISQLIVPYVSDPFTLFLDEAGSISKDITTILLTILNPNETNSATLQTPNGNFEFRRDKHTFILATSEAQSVFHSLQDRLVRIELDSYNKSELAEIIRRKLKAVKFEDGVLEEMASVLRGNPRSATLLTDDVKTYLKGAFCFGHKNWKELKDILSILPSGLNSMELRVLKHLGEHLQGVSLTNLSSKTGMTREALQRNYEPFLMGLDLIGVSKTGRSITAKGMDYLNNLACAN